MRRTLCTTGATKKRKKFCRRAICPNRSRRQKARTPSCPSRRIRRRRSICAASSAIHTKMKYGLRWTRQTAAEEKDLFYWLHQSGFYPQSQLASAARLMGNYQSGSVSVQNLTGCSLYRYEPCTVLPERAGLGEKQNSAVYALKQAVCAVSAAIPMRRFRTHRRLLPELTGLFAKRHVGRREIVLTDGKRVPRICVFLRADRSRGVPRAARRGAG